MSRKRPVIESWLCYLDDSPRGQTYIRLTSGLLTCDKFRALSPLAQVIYINMAAHAAGKIEFEFPHSAYRGLCSNDGFNKAEKALIERGFISKLESGRFTRTPNRYRFVSDWKRR